MSRRRDRRRPRYNVGGGAAIAAVCLLTAVAIHVAGAIDRRDWATLANYLLGVLVLAALARWRRRRGATPARPEIRPHRPWWGRR